MDIDKNVCRETLDFTKDTDNNWKKLIRENEKERKEYLANKKKKRKSKADSSFEFLFKGSVLKFSGLFRIFEAGKVWYKNRSRLRCTFMSSYKKAETG
ncbi:MAG: hypothetical protein IPF54_18280 [Draconibacterium sp.]|nr:hypothetical protein [Draconibacterium sp.]